MDLLRPTVFNISKVAIIKTESATIAFFSSPPFFFLRSFFFSFPFPSPTVILELLGLKKPASV